MRLFTRLTTKLQTIIQSNKMQNDFLFAFYANWAFNGVQKYIFFVLVNICLASNLLLVCNSHGHQKAHILQCIFIYIFFPMHSLLHFFKVIFVSLRICLCQKSDLPLKRIWIRFGFEFVWDLTDIARYLVLVR